MTTPQPNRPHGWPVDNAEGTAMMQGAYQQGRGPSEDAGGNDSAEGPKTSRAASLCSFPLFFNEFHVPKHIPKEGLLLGEQRIYLIQLFKPEPEDRKK